VQPRLNRHCAAALPPPCAGLPGDVLAPHRLGNALEQTRRLASPHRPPRGAAGSTGAAALCPCHDFLSPPVPLVRGLRPSLRSWRSAAVPLLADPEGGADGVCLSTGFAPSLHGVAMSCPRAPASRPGLTAHEQDGHRSLGASEGKRTCSGTSVLADAAWAWAGVQRGGSVPPHPSPVAALRCRSNSLLLPGCVLPGTGGGRVLLPPTASRGSGAPWRWPTPGSRRRLPVAAALFLPPQDAQCM
jgi:hypothetical protein